MILNSPYISGSLTVTGNSTFTGTMTATTLVVQTVTSSVNFITGSTKFGSISANTHVFTGSINVTGSAATFTGNIGLGTISPNIGGYGANSRLLTVQGVNGSYGILELTSNSANADGSAIGRLDFGSDGQAANYKAISSIASFLSGATSTKFGADLRFYTRADNAASGDPSERIRITSTGHLLIGTSTDLNFLGAWDNGVTRIGTGGLFFSYRDNDDNFMISQNYYINSAGNDVRVNAGGASNIYMADGEMYFRTAANGTAGSTLSWRNPLLLKNSGRALVNTTTDRGYTFQVNGDVTSYACEIRQDYNSANYDLLTLTHEATSGNRRMVIFNTGGYGTVGTIISTNSSTTYNTSSDYRLKQDLKNFKGLDIVDSIKTYDFEWKVDNTRSYGVLAHELQEVLPYTVYGEKDGEYMQGVDYSKIVPVLVKAIQELKTQNDSLQSQINELKAQ